MKTFRQFLEESYYLIEARRQSGRATYNDEHAVARIWNHFVNDETYQKHLAAGEHDEALKHMRSEVKKAREDKSHPLHVSNAGHEGFSGGRRTREHHHSYHREMSTATKHVHSLATSERRGRSAAAKRLPMRVVGATKAPVSKFWGKHTGKKEDAPKTDLQIYDPSNPKYSIRISKKKSRTAQLMSPTPKEAAATYRSAAKSLAKEMRKAGKSREEAQAMQRDVHTGMEKVSRALAAMGHSRATRRRQHLLKAIAKKHLTAVHAAHPDIARHVSHEGQTGESKFGRGSRAQLGLIGPNVEELSHQGRRGVIPPAIMTSLPKHKGGKGVLRAVPRTRSKMKPGGN